MSVEHDLLDARQQRIISVDVAPAHLRHADSFIREEINHLAQAIRTRQKVRIKNCHQFPFSSLHRVFQRSCLKSRPIRAVNVMDVVTVSLIFGDGDFSNLHRFIRRIITDLNFQEMARIIKFRHGFQQSLNDIQFIKKRKLHGDAWQFVFSKYPFGLRLHVAITPEVIHHPQAIQTQNRQQPKQREINNNDRQIKAIQRN